MVALSIGAYYTPLRTTANKGILDNHILGSVVGIDVDIGKELSYSNGYSSTVYRYIGGIWSFQSLRIQS